MWSESITWHVFADIDECGTGRHSCANDTVCFNLDGGYDCRCPHGKNCTGDCIHEDKIKHNGQIWVLENDRCSVCSCQVSRNRTSCFCKMVVGMKGRAAWFRWNSWFSCLVRRACSATEKWNYLLHTVLGRASLSNLHEWNFHGRFILWYWEKDDGTIFSAEIPPVFSGWE